jgi:hypothetical protein
VMTRKMPPTPSSASQTKFVPENHNQREPGPGSRIHRPIIIANRLL